jgi:uncharacterized lipoprotein YajG
MKMKKLVFILLMAYALIGCKQEPVSGYVVGKAYIPKHSVSNYNIILKIPQSKVIPEAYVVWVADSCRVISLHVDKQTFDRLERGQFILKKEWKK